MKFLSGFKIALLSRLGRNKVLFKNTYLVVRCRYFALSYHEDSLILQKNDIYKQITNYVFDFIICPPFECATSGLNS